MQKYQLHLNDNPDRLWSQKIQHNYELYLKTNKPLNHSVTFLVFAGISYNGYESDYFPKSMQMQYALCFDEHQRPFKTKVLHSYFIHKLPYFYYLWFIAAPVDVFVHTFQLFIGEHGYLFEGGIFFIPYLFLHFILTFISISANIIYRYPSLWDIYFYILRKTLSANEVLYSITEVGSRLPLIFRLSEYYFLYYLFYHAFNV